MNTKPYNEWINLYNEDLSNIWHSQHSELRNAAMLLRVLESEFKRIYNRMETQYKVSEERIKSLEKYNSALETDRWNSEKENLSPNTSQQKTNASEVFSICSSLEAIDNSLNDDEDIVAGSSFEARTCISPKINRMRNIARFKRKRQCSLIPNSPLSDVTGAKLAGINDIIDSTPDNTKRTFKNKSKLRLQFDNRKADDIKAPYCPFITKLHDSIPINDKKGKSVKYEQNNMSTESIVRGKARKKLEGWNCPECEEFYKELDLNSQQRKEALNRCSKHRSKVKPQNYSPKKLWDLNFPQSPNEVLSSSNYLQY